MACSADNDEEEEEEEGGWNGTLVVADELFCRAGLAGSESCVLGVGRAAELESASLEAGKEAASWRDSENENENPNRQREAEKGWGRSVALHKEWQLGITGSLTWISGRRRLRRRRSLGPLHIGHKHPRSRSL